MRVVEPSTINGAVTAPPSKSMMIRAVAAAVLADGTSVLQNPSFSVDGMASLRLAGAMGAVVSREGDSVSISGTEAFRSNGLSRLLDCGESGLCMRLFGPLAASGRGTTVLTASGSLRRRPMGMVEDLAGLGALCRTRNGFPPITVKGPITGGHITVDGSESSQFLTGLLMALPLCHDDSLVEVPRLASKPYVSMTLNLLERFGVSITVDSPYRLFHIAGHQHYVPCCCTIEGDWSGAAFLLVAGAIAGRVEVKGLDTDSPQADRRILEALTQAGAVVADQDGSVTVTTNKLRGFDFDATDAPDLLPPLVALASHCQGISVFFGADRLIHKESNRASVLLSEFRRLGIALDVKDNRLIVKGGRVTGGVVDSHNDHRIAMACAVAALRGEADAVVRGAGCVSKSYPDFFSVLDSLKEHDEQFR